MKCDHQLDNLWDSCRTEREMWCIRCLLVMMRGLKRWLRLCLQATGVLLLVGLLLIQKGRIQRIHSKDNQYEPQLPEEQYSSTVPSSSLSSSDDLRKPTTFSDVLKPPLNYNITVHTHRLLNTFARDLSMQRWKMLLWKVPWPNLKVANRTKLLASQPDFFSHLDNHHHAISVHYLKVLKVDLASVLQRPFYDYTSNDCSKTETNSKGSKGVIQSLYNATCFSKMTGGLFSRLQDSKAGSLKMGMPDRYKPTTGEIVLAYAILARNVVVDINGDVTTNHITIVPTRCRHTYVYENLRNKDPEDLPLYDEVFTMQLFFGEQFYHATLESLPRIVPYLDFLRNNPHIMIHTGYKHPFLTRLGIDPSRIITGNIRAKFVIIPNGSRCGMSHPFTTQLLSDALQPLNQSTQDTIVLIKRSRAKTRYFKHHDAILQMLWEESRPYNMRVQVFNDKPLPSLRRTIDMFSRAIVVVSPHGAGASNMLFSQPGTVLLEGLHPGPEIYPNLCFISFAQALGLRYHGIFKSGGVTEYTAEDIRGPIRFFLRHLGEISHKSP